MFSPIRTAVSPIRISVLIGEDWNYYYSKQKEIGLVAPHNALMLNLFPENCHFIWLSHEKRAVLLYEVLRNWEDFRNFADENQIK